MSHRSKRKDNVKNEINVPKEAYKHISEEEAKKRP